MLEYLTHDTGDNPDTLVLWLHGLGADGHDFEPVVPQFKNPNKSIRFVFPHAPVQPVTINGGMRMRSWYDIKMMDIGKMPDEQGILDSAKKIQTLLQHHWDNGFTPAQTVLAGFSQGGAMSLHIATRFEHTLAGVVALSCYLPMAEQLSTKASTANQNTPFFMGHGTFDPVVPYALGQSSFDTLKAAGYPVQWHEYPLQHGVSMDELEDIKQFILKLA